MYQLRAFRCLIVLLAAVVVCWPPVAAENEIEATDRRIFQEIREHNHLVENLQYLSDSIGARVTGTDQLQKAVNWASDLSRRYGLENVHAEG